MADKPFTVSYSSMATFRRCKTRYYWQYVLGHRTKPSSSQAVGIAGHNALAEWHRNYQPVPALDAAWNSWVSQGYEDGSDWQRLNSALKRYFAMPLDKFKLVEAEKRFEIRYEVLGQPVIFKGFIDGILKDEADQTWLLENKFQKQAQSTGLDFNAQATTYMLAATLLGLNPLGLLYNIVRVADTKVATEEPALRKTMLMSTQGLGMFEEEVQAQIAEMILFHRDPKPYRNLIRDCSWDCSFRTPCLVMGEDGVHPELELKRLERQNG